jgi:hypothetical protein
VIILLVIIVMMMRSRLAARTFPLMSVDGRPSSQFGIDPRDQRRLSTAAFRNPVYSDPENGTDNGYHKGPASEGLYDDPEFMGFGFGGVQNTDYFDIAPQKAEYADMAAPKAGESDVYVEVTALPSGKTEA